MGRAPPQPLTFHEDLQIDLAVAAVAVRRVHDVAVVGAGKFCICIISFHLHTTLSHPHFTDEKTKAM